MRFLEPVHEAFKFYRKLYAIEKEARDNQLTSEARYQLRQEKSVVILNAFMLSKLILNKLIKNLIVKFVASGFFLELILKYFFTF